MLHLLFKEKRLVPYLAEQVSLKGKSENRFRYFKKFLDISKNKTELEQYKDIMNDPAEVYHFVFGNE